MNEEEVTTQAEEQPDIPLFSKIIGVFVSPGAAFASIIRKPNWLVPFIIISIAGMALAYLTADIAIEDQRNIISMNERMDPEMREQQLDALDARKESGTKYLGLIAAPIMTLIIAAVSAGAFLFVGNILLGGAANFKMIFALTMWARLIDIPTYIVKTPLMLNKGTMDVQTSLAVFMQSEIPHSFMYYFLTSFDIFAFWYMGILTIAFAMLFRFELKKASMVVIFPWLLAALLTAGFSSFMMKMALGG